MQKPPNSPIRLALVAYPGAQRSAVEGLADLFALLPRLSRGEEAIQRLETRTVTETDRPAGSVDAFVFPPSLESTQARPDHPLAHWARAQHGAGALACSVCAGAFWLGHAGLLDRRPATTHWALEPAFRAAFPQVELQPDHILVDDLDIVTAGGLMAWLDLGLHLTGLWFGPDMVSRLARHLLVDPAGREQRHYSGFRPARGHGDAAVLRAQRRIETGFADPLSVADLATHAGLSERTFLRRFQAATGLGPAAYLQRLRVEKARGALERSGGTTAEIAWSVGYRDPSAFARAFKSGTGLTPGAYRARFRVTPRPQRPAALCRPAGARI
ncbi:GlxA family transcriptional regulator [Antarcticimicrobium luteum]|nr:helix-turn-helix domain-containing protein [Antarcticimicrobium luteum]